ncbi:hypothetical protein M758_2G193100 [Ceratodon purpureus]|nr:hypothetical protein M758_2G193100 [Ceratodon purpureus]
MSTSSDSDGSNGRQHSSRSSKAKSYECKICGKEFSTGQSLGGHMNVHRKDQRNGRSSRSSTPPGGDYYASTSTDSSSTYKGVRYRSEQNKWVAEIRPPRSSKTWWLGTYSTPIEAAYAYDVAITYFGSETSLNFDGHPVYDQIPRISPNLPKQDFASQLRKVVKEYGKLAMQSGPSAEVEEEDASSSSYGAQDQFMSSGPVYEQQQEEYVVTDFDQDQLIDWDTALSDQPTFTAEADQSFSPNYNASFDVFDMPPVAFENSYTGAYQPTSDYEPASASYYNQMSPAMSDYEPSGYNNGYYQPQQQLWSHYYSY